MVRLLGSGGFGMDDGAEQSFCAFLGIENHDGHELPAS